MPNLEGGMPGKSEQNYLGNIECIPCSGCITMQRQSIDGVCRSAWAVMNQIWNMKRMMTVDAVEVGEPFGGCLPV
jgi:hypothetical protein